MADKTDESEGYLQSQQLRDREVIFVADALEVVLHPNGKHNLELLTHDSSSFQTWP
jgi:hypothetical protein